MTYDFRGNTFTSINVIESTVESVLRHVKVQLRKTVEF